MALAASGCGRERQEGLFGDGPPPVEQAPPVPYRVKFPEDLPPELGRLLPDASRANRLASEPPTSELVVRRRALDDVPRLEAALRSAGYYDGRVSTELERSGEPPGEGAEAPPLVVRFDVVPGPVYRFERTAVELEGETGGFAAPRPAELKLAPGEPARAQAVLDAEQELLKRARKAGHALAKLGRRSTVIDNERRTMDVTLRLAPGPQARFGEVTFEGARGIDTGFLRRRLPFKPGEVYDPEAVELSRSNLYDTNLLSTLVLEEGKELAPDGRLPITIRVTPRAFRSVGAGLGYQTDTGPNASVFWEHRNLLGSGERFRAETELSLVQQQAELTYRVPDFLSTRQALITSAEARAEETDAYASKSVSAAIGIERPLAEGVIGRLGVAYRFASIQEEGEPEQVFGLLSFPGQIDWDFSDDLLNPTRGGRVSASATPFIDTLGPDRNFLRTRLTGTRYLSLVKEPRLILALRGSVGSEVGVSREEIPADERFYAGGGGSVRGFGYQLAGPLDEDDEPLGGRSLLELTAELRYRVTESIGAVLFADGGTVFAGPYPDLSESLRWGAGPGLRYYTPIGPLRLDIGFPLNPREGVDDLFQLYLSIGQAF